MVPKVPRVPRVLQVVALSAVVFLLAGAADASQPQPPTGFVPVDDIPPGEQIPAINLVAAAYGFVWIAVMGYVWSIAKRLKQVETELDELQSRKK